MTLPIRNSNDKSKVVFCRLLNRAMSNQFVSKNTSCAIAISYCVVTANANNLGRPLAHCKSVYLTKIYDNISRGCVSQPFSNRFSYSRDLIIMYLVSYHLPFGNIFKCQRKLHTDTNIDIFFNIDLYFIPLLG